MGQRVDFSGELNRLGEAQGNRVRTGRFSRWDQTRNQAIYPWPG